LPDGIFSNLKSKFGKILEGLAMEKVGIPILWPFGTLYGHWVILFLILFFSNFLVYCVHKEKSGNPRVEA
jgi:hypothetical protein